MLKTLMMSAAVSALMISGALAQANPPVNSPGRQRRKTKRRRSTAQSSFKRRARTSGCSRSSRVLTCWARTMRRWAISRPVVRPERQDRGSDRRRRRLSRHRREERGHRHERVSRVMPTAGEQRRRQQCQRSGQRSHRRESEGDVDEGSAQERARFPVLPRPARTTERPATSPTTGMAPRPAPGRGSSALVAALVSER